MSKQQVQEGSGCNNGGVSCIEPNFPQKYFVWNIKNTQLPEGTREKSKVGRNRRG